MPLSESLRGIPAERSMFSAGLADGQQLAQRWARASEPLPAAGRAPATATPTPPERAAPAPR
jgi:hypothetical protein